ncbi:MAG: GNAT family N-acetyltransferase [bacterium]|nr:GNAT family N-acetyltransferase [bacterium]
MSQIELREESLSQLSDYAKLSIRFTVASVLTLHQTDDQLSGFPLTETGIENPYEKDYDAIPGNHPTEWVKRFDVSQWGMICAYHEQNRIGGAIIAHNTKSVHMLEERAELAVLWDLRVAGAWRGNGVGKRLFDAAEAWAKQRDCHWLKIETQNNNVAACRFYARCGCVLGAIHRFAYPEYPEEIQLLWYKSLEE